MIEYRDMATIVRDRIREYVKRGMTLDQVKAKKPTLDFDPRYGTDTGFWTTSMFVETIYKEMVAKNPPAPREGRQRNRRTSQKGSGNEAGYSEDGTAPRVRRLARCAADVRVREIEPRRQASLSRPQASSRRRARGGAWRGRGPAGPPPPARQAAPVDLTGNWVSVVTEDWQWRMRTPPKGDYASVPLTPRARQVADTWEPSKDGRARPMASAASCACPTAAYQLAGRQHAEDRNRCRTADAAAAIYAAGRGSRSVPVSAAHARCRGTSVAEWQRRRRVRRVPRARRRAAPPRWGSLKVVTTEHAAAGCAATACPTARTR